MINFFIDFFKRQNIEFYACLPTSELNIINSRKMPSGIRSAVVFLIPYNMKENCIANISKYAIPYDYHLYVKLLFAEFKNEFSLAFPYAEEVFCFSDSSPVAEVEAATKAGLGVLGKNRLLINKKYGSFCFIASFLIKEDLSFCSSNIDKTFSTCLNCSVCQKACITGCLCENSQSECMSSITQTKKLSPEQEEKLLSSPLVWGCDICQDVCPMNKGVADTPIEFFRQNRLGFITFDIIENMSDEEFKKRAYSWRGKEVLLRNLKKLQ